MTFSCDKDNDQRINPNGGAIAIGHPLVMSGTRILEAAKNELIRSGGKFGIAAMCVGVGMGYSTIIENLK
ncbi:MAG: hypothetical protein AB8B59_03660 [Maribacter sp.]